METTKSDTMNFLAIIGGGPAGYTAAEKASKAGKDVVLFEQNALGGTCLNVGCIPTKTLLYSAKLYHNAQNAAKYGVTAENVTFDYAKIAQRKTKVVRKLVAGIRQRLNNGHCRVVNGEPAYLYRLYQFCSAYSRTERQSCRVGFHRCIGGYYSAAVNDYRGRWRHRYGVCHALPRVGRTRYGHRGNADYPAEP